MGMASRKKKSENVLTTDEARAFTVVVEQMQGHFKAFGERLDLMEEKLSRRFDEVERRLERIETTGSTVTRMLESKVDRDDVEKIVERVVARHAS
jgi:hypothetical protein